MKASDAVFVIGVTAVLAACNQQAAVASHAAAPRESAATTRQVMLAMTVPTSNAVFAAAGEAPADDAAWALAEANAVILAESAQMLKTGARAVDQKNWLQFSDALIKAAEAAAHAAHDKNAEQFGGSSDAIYQTCEDCHKQYLIAKKD
jgi:7-cyano-7-deazaguanine synthase in queuosine biosynthesis